MHRRHGSTSLSQNEYNISNSRGLCKGGGGNSYAYTSFAGKTEDTIVKCVSSLAEQRAVGAHNDRMEGERFTAGGHGPLGGPLNAPTAGDRHPYNGDAADVVLSQNGGELFTIVPFVQLGAADKGHPAPDKVPVKGAVGVGGAVGSNEKITAVKVGRVDRSELDLNRPLAQFTGDISSGGGGFRPADGPALAAGTAAGQGLVRGPGRLGGQDRRMVVGGGPHAPQR